MQTQATDLVNSCTNSMCPNKDLFWISDHHMMDKGLRCILAIGHLAIGHLAIGHLAIGILSIGHLAIGILSIGHLAIGILAIGHLAMGILAINVNWQ